MRKELRRNSTIKKGQKVRLKDDIIILQEYRGDNTVIKPRNEAEAEGYFGDIYMKKGVWKATFDGDLEDNEWVNYKGTIRDTSLNINWLDKRYGIRD